MKWTTHFLKTEKELASGVESRNGQLLLQAGYIHQEMAGVYSFLPLGLKVLRNIEHIVRQEMDAAGCAEMHMGTLCPQQNWEKTNRWKDFDVLYKVDLAAGGMAALCPTHEEVITPLVQRYVKSYKDFPVALYQFQTKFRNEPRAKSGLLRGREFLMKDAYSFHTSQDDLDAFYARMTDAYTRVFDRLGLGEITRETMASGGAFSKYSHEFQTLHPVGEDTLFIDDVTGETWNKEIATGTPDQKNTTETPKPIESKQIERPANIQASAELYGCETWRILKNVVMVADDGTYVIASVRGDTEVSPLLLEDLVGQPIRPATREELTAAGFAIGFISTINLQVNVPVAYYADASVKTVVNAITGANEMNVDYLNVNLTDLPENTTWGNFTVPTAGYTSPSGNPYRIEKAVEVGNIFKLGTKFSNAFGFQHIAADGKAADVVMGCYGIGISRLMGVLAEVMSDEKGLVWPAAVAPAHVHMVVYGKSDDVYTQADNLAAQLHQHGITTLQDDRNEKKIGFGHKMRDADLLGLPLRIVITEKTLAEGEVEVSTRTGDNTEPTRLKLEDAQAWIKSRL